MGRTVVVVVPSSLKSAARAHRLGHVRDMCVLVDSAKTHVDFWHRIAAEVERKSRSDGYRHDQRDESCVMA